MTIAINRSIPHRYNDHRDHYRHESSSHKSSSSSSATPSSRKSRSAKHNAAPAAPSSQDHMDISNSRDGTPTYENSDHHDNNANNHHAGHSHQGGGGGSGSLSAALPPMTSHPQNNCSAAAAASSNAAAGSGGAAPAVSTQDALKTIQTALLLTSGSVNHTRDAVAAVSGHGSISSARESPSVRGRGDSTPTHSEAGNSQYQNSSGSNHHGHHHGHHGHMDRLHHHHQHGLSHMVSSSPLTALKSQMISLTPSLSKLYKESLISHVAHWPAEAVERMAARVNEDHNNISNLGVTKVSAELKMARSLVRLAEIQATLQEQRILFLRQQSLDLEALGTTTRSSSSHQLHHQHSASSSTSEPNTPSKASAAASAPQLVLPAVPAPNCNQQLQQHDGAAAAAAPGNHSNSYNHQ